MGEKWLRIRDKRGWKRPDSRILSRDVVSLFMDALVSMEKSVEYRQEFQINVSSAGVVMMLWAIYGQQPLVVFILGAILYYWG